MFPCSARMNLKLDPSDAFGFFRRIGRFIAFLKSYQSYKGKNPTKEPKCIINLFGF